MKAHLPSHIHVDSTGMAYARSFLRTYLIGTGFNTRGMQNIGLVYAMQPGLSAIHKDPVELRNALKRYVRHYQSHPFWAPCLVGILLHVERAIAENKFPAKMLPKVKDTTSYTLSAIGDSVFAGSLLILWAMLSICLLLSGFGWVAFTLGVLLLIGLQAFRVYTFVRGVRLGFRFLEQLKRWDLINWGQRVKYVNAVLILWLWALIWPRPYRWWEVLAGAAILMFFARYVRTGLMSRVLAVAVFVASIELYQLAEALINNGFGL